MSPPHAERRHPHPGGIHHPGPGHGPSGGRGLTPRRAGNGTTTLPAPAAIQSPAKPPESETTRPITARLRLPAELLVLAIRDLDSRFLKEMRDEGDLYLSAVPSRRVEFCRRLLRVLNRPTEDVPEDFEDPATVGTGAADTNVGAPVPLYEPPPDVLGSRPRVDIVGLNATPKTGPVELPPQPAPANQLDGPTTTRMAATRTLRLEFCRLYGQFHDRARSADTRVLCRPLPLRRVGDLSRRCSRSPVGL